MDHHSATAKHDGDLLEHPFLSRDTTRDMSEIMLAPLVYPLGIGGGKKTSQYVKVYIRDFQKPLRQHSVADSGSFGKAMPRNFKWLS